MDRNSKCGSIVDPFYRDGKFQSESNGEKDAQYKVSGLLELISNFPELLSQIKQVADVGCGTGKTTQLMQEALTRQGYSGISYWGYDVHPVVNTFPKTENVRFVWDDFCLSDQEVDLVVLLDVLEHIPDPVGFLHKISERTSWLVCHIPLDASFFSGIRNLHRANLRHPGHLIVLDMPAALNIIAFGGFRSINYSYSPVFRAPSGQATLSQKILFPFRELLYRVSPFILQKTFGGVSLFVLAASSNGLNRSVSKTIAK